MLVVEKLLQGDSTTSRDLKGISVEKLTAFEGWLYQEIEDAFSQRAAQETAWIDALKDYEAKPAFPEINVPIEDAPNIVVPLGAIAAESIYSIAIDLIFGTSPVLTVRCPDADVAKGMQILADKLVASPNVQFKSAVKNSVLDVVNLGTGITYTPYVEGTKKTDINKVKFFGPRIYPIPIEDIIVPGGSIGEIETLRWIAMRTYPSENELNLRAKRGGWDITAATPAGTVDNVRRARETLAKTLTSGNRSQKFYEILDIYITYDIDGDGVDEDLLVFYDRTSKKILHYRYNPYERRPFRKACYQIRAHQWAGMGIPEMLHQLQDETTKIHNHRTLNLMLANLRMWLSRTGTFPTGNVVVWANRNIEVNNMEDVKELKLSDVYPSAGMAEANTLQLAERRVGSELPLPKPSQLMSSRTPATTTTAMLQQVNRRFSPAFEEIRDMCGGSIKDCLIRFQECLLKGDADVERWITETVGDQKLAGAVIVALKSESFDDEVNVTLTASSATVNKDVDKQNMLLLVNIAVQYYQRVLELITIASNPQTPPPVQQVAAQIATKAGEIFDRVMRTFDNVRDPQALVIQLNEGLDQGAEALPPEGLQGLAAMLTPMTQMGSGALENGGPAQ